VLRATFPETYTRRLRLRFAPLVKLHLDNEYARASVTRRIGRLHGKAVYYGPFLSRASAEKFMNDSLDFFKMRRCVEDLHPDPAFPGCIYSEMKMCLAPCFKGCTDEEYRGEVERVQSYFDSGGTTLVREIERQREQSAEQLAFEDAAALHARIDKIKPVMAQLPEAVQRLDRMEALMVQRSSEPGCVALVRVRAGILAGPVAFPIQAAEHSKSQSMEARVQQALEGMPSAHRPGTLETMEHLAILKRWVYRGKRAGEIFFANESGELPMRRIVRGIARVYRGESPEPAPAATPPAS
jgi:excinuclease ABC subunit C